MQVNKIRDLLSVSSNSERISPYRAIPTVQWRWAIRVSFASCLSMRCSSDRLDQAVRQQSQDQRRADRCQPVDINVVKARGNRYAADRRSIILVLWAFTSLHLAGCTYAGFLFNDAPIMAWAFREHNREGGRGIFVPPPTVEEFFFAASALPISADPANLLELSLWTIIVR